MVRMLFTLPQKKVNVVPLPDGMYDVTVLDNEEQVDTVSGENEEVSVKMYQYDGNQFRTVYELTEEEILADLEKYLNYSSKNEPTLKELKREKEIIQNYENGLMKAVKEAVNSD